MNRLIKGHSKPFKIIMIIFLFMCLFQQIKAQISSEFTQKNIDIEYGKFFTHTVRQNDSKSLALLYEIDPTQQYQFFMFRCQGDNIYSLYDVEVEFDIFYTQEQFNNASYTTKRYIDLIRKSQASTYPCFSSFIQYQLTYSNYLSLICATDNICTQVIKLRRSIEDDIDYYFSFFDYYEAGGVVVQNTPTNINSYLQLGFKSIDISKLFVLSITDFAGFQLRYEFNQDKSLRDQFDYSVDPRTIAVIMDKDVVDNFQSKVQASSYASTNFDAMDYFENKEYQVFKLYDCYSCQAQVQMYVSRSTSNSRYIRGYMRFELVSEISSLSQLTIPNSETFHVTKIKFPNSIEYLQISRNEENDDDRSQLYNVNNIVLYPKSSNQSYNTVIETQSSNYFWAYNIFLQGLNNIQEAYVLSTNPSYEEITYDIQHKGQSVVYTDNSELLMGYSETGIYFLFKADKDKNKLQFNNPPQNSTLFLNSCGTDDTDCVIPTIENHKYKIVQNSTNYNLDVQFDKKFKDEEYFLGYITTPYFANITKQYHQDTNLREAVLLTGYSAKLLFNDKFVYNIDMDNWVIVLLFEIGLLVLIFLSVLACYYWKKKNISTQLDEKLHQFTVYRNIKNCMSSII